MFEDQTVELLPARTVMTVWSGHPGKGKHNGSSTTVTQTATNTGSITQTQTVKVIAPNNSGTITVDTAQVANTGNVAVVVPSS